MIRQRWTNLRRCFIREETTKNVERTERENNQPVKPRKIYMYYNAMKFLSEHEDHRAHQNDNESDGNESISSNSTKSEVGSSERDTVKRRKMSVKTEPKLVNTSEVNETDGFFATQSEIDTSQRIDEDEDRQFLLSLVPTLRSLSAENKFEARIEMLKVLKEISLRQYNDKSN